MKKEIVISPQRALGVFPGYLASIKDQYFSLNTACENEIWGRLSIFTYSCTQSIESFLKYKIQSEGRQVENIHNLLRLFNTLSNQEQELIRKSFAKLKVRHKITPLNFVSKEAEVNFRRTKNEIGIPEFYHPSKWNKVDDILEQIKDGINWRYVVEEKKSGFIETSRLYLLVCSIYNTLDKP